MAKILFTIVCFLMVSCTLHIKLTIQTTLIPGTVNIKAENGYYLARCNNCGQGAYPDSAGVHELNNSNPWAIWHIQQVGDKFAIKADTGKYLARCNGCWQNQLYPDSAFVHVPSLQGNPWALWTVVSLSNGKIGFKADNGLFLAKCTQCAIGAAYPQFAFVYERYAYIYQAQWTVTYRFPQGTVILQSDNGAYLSRCNNCGNGIYPDSASLHETNPGTYWTHWQIQKYGNQIALKGDSGKYLALCHSCWQNGDYPDSAFVYVESLVGNSQALWNPVWIGNGNWGLQGSNGKFLARCSGCIPSGFYENMAFVHSVSSSKQPWAQWKISNV